MATISFLSDQLTNRVATPPVLNSYSQGKLVRYWAYELLGTAHDDTEILAMMSLPTSCSVMSVKLFTDGAATTGAADIGLYTPDNELLTAGTVVDADLFGSAVAVTSAATGTEILLESTILTIDDIGKPLWEMAGATSDPNGEYLVCATFTADVDAETTFGLMIDVIH